MGNQRDIRSLPRLKTLFVTFTDACNSRCATCDFWRREKPHTLDTALLARDISEAYKQGLTTVYFTGGEPLVRASELFDLVDRLRRDCPTLKLHLLSNGLMLKKFATEVTARFPRVIVSLDARTPDVYHAIRGVHSFSVVLEGIRRLRETAPHVSIRLRTLVLPENVDTLGDLVLLARELGVDRISFLAEDDSTAAFGPHPGARASMGGGRHQLLVAPIDQQIARIESLFAEDPELPVVAGLQDLRRVRELYRSGKSPAPCNAGDLSCVVEADGSVSPCFFIPTTLSVRDGGLAHVRRSESWQDVVEAISAGLRSECGCCVCPRFDTFDD